MKTMITIVIMSFLVACSSLDHQCSDGAEITGPRDTTKTIDRACYQYADRAGEDIEDLSLAGTQIAVRPWREPTQCRSGARACARLLPEPIKIDVENDDWRALLIHEVYHVLLWKTRPDIHPDDHHRWLFDRRLCAPDGSLCGYGLRGPQ